MSMLFTTWIVWPQERRCVADGGPGQGVVGGGGGAWEAMVAVVVLIWSGQLDGFGLADGSVEEFGRGEAKSMPKCVVLNDLVTCT